MELLQKRLANLLTIKSLVTLTLTGVVIAFYFGTQAEKSANKAA